MKPWLLPLCSSWLCAAIPALALDEPVDLLEDRDLSAFLVQLHPHRSLSSLPERTFRFLEDGILQVTGRAWGTLRTEQSYAGYHLVLEYKWGEHTWKERADRARDAGVFLHIQTPAPVIDGSWPHGVETKILEGATGGLAILGPQGIAGKPAAYRSLEWIDRKGFRGADDAESLFGDWNRLEIIARDATVTVKLNGEVVNETSGLPFRSGPVALQSEWAEYFVRRWELHPLGSFDEAWKPAGKSQNTGSGADLVARKHALSPEESLRRFEVDGPWKVELVAAEPLVCDPVDVVWDARGRLYVAEMRDYPLPPEHGPLLSRIRLLEDTDADGLPDRATTWAAPLDHVQGLLPLRGGILATTRTEIVYLEDTDEDGRADLREVWFRSNEPRHNQLQISSPRWGRDNWIYLNNGLDGKEIYPQPGGEPKRDIGRRNLRIHPQTRALETVTGYGQFGASIDDWGRRFFCSNRNPVMTAILPAPALERNPPARLGQGHGDIAPAGGEATVYPLHLSHTTAAAHLGTHTAACGLAVYRGRFLPELDGDLFVCEPTGQLVTRNRIHGDVASLRAERVRLRPQSEFLRSSDEWFRPVNLRNGPDGALYICDMQRRFIDHSRFFPDEFARAHYMRAGCDQGRIWRIVPAGGNAESVSIPRTTAGRVAALDHPSGWVRDTAQRLLVEAPDPEAAPLLERMLRDGSPRGRTHALWTMAGLGWLEAFHVRTALADSHPRVLECAIRLIGEVAADPPSFRDAVLALTRHEDPRVRLESVLWLGRFPQEPVTQALAAVAARDFSDPWMRKALLSAAKGRAGRFLQAAFQAPDFRDRPTPAKREFLQRFAFAAGSGADADRLDALAPAIEGETGWWQYPVIDGLYEGIRRYRSRTKNRDLPASLPDFSRFLGMAAAHAASEQLPVERRVAAMPLLRHLPADEALPVFTRLVTTDQPPPVRQAAFKIARNLNRKRVSSILLKRWPELSATTRKEALELLSRSAAKPLLEHMKGGTINPALLDSMSRWRFLRSRNDEIRTLAEELFSQPSSDRAGVLRTYRSALERPGDPQSGAEVFAANCATCHRFRGTGTQVGPDITDVRNKPAEALLSDILDPNRMMEARWASYAVETRDGRALLGLIEAETADTITLRGPGFVETLSRSEIKKSIELDRSLMPVGFEGSINPEKMADLLAFLLQ